MLLSHKINTFSIYYHMLSENQQNWNAETFTKAYLSKPQEVNLVYLTCFFVVSKQTEFKSVIYWYPYTVLCARVI